MREILFRAWSEKEKCYRRNVGIYNGHAVRYGYQWYSLDNDVFDSNPEQFTGLVDKNGEWIFEGDIMLLCDNYKCVIEYDRELARFKAKGLDRLIVQVSVCFWGQGQIIGNIHDNPELMEDK